MLKAMLDWAFDEKHKDAKFTVTLISPVDEEFDLVDRKVITYGDGWVAIAPLLDEDQGPDARMYINETHVAAAWVNWNVEA